MIGWYEVDLKGLLLCESNCIVSGVVIGSIEWVCLINPRKEA